MTIALFKTLIAISDTGSFRGAADKVCVTHAAVGQQMRRLEETFGVALFDRSEKTPRLNQLGKAFVPKAKAVVLSYETILDDLNGDPHLIGALKLGAVPSSIRGLIPKTAKRVMQLYPDLHLQIVPDLSPDLLEMVEQGTLDAAVLSAPARVPDHLNWMPFCAEELVLLTSQDVQGDDPRRILETHPYLRHNRRASVGVLAEEWLSDNKIKVRDAMEINSLGNLASMVSHDLGVSLAPDICMPDTIYASLRKISLGPTPPRRVLGLLTRADCSKLRLVDKVLAEIEQVLRDAEQNGD